MVPCVLSHSPASKCNFVLSFWYKTNNTQNKSRKVRTERFCSLQPHNGVQFVFILEIAILQLTLPSSMRRCAVEGGGGGAAGSTFHVVAQLRTKIEIMKNTLPLP